MLLALLIAAQTYGPQHLPPVTEAEDPLVDTATVVGGLIVDLAYAKADNIAGRALYPPDAKCLLRRSVAQRLALAADALRKQGLRLVARDCTRPADSQRVLWEAYPRAGAVAEPSISSLPISPARPWSSRRSSTRSVRMPRPMRRCRMAPPRNIAKR
jgi:D-alanyl-D-alanine dipeptidase